MTPTRLTKAGQETAVGEGLAVGCMALGVSAVTAERLAVDLSFIDAWREWPHARRFPVVRASLERNDIFRILRASEGRRGGIYAAWEVGRRYVPYLRGDWTVEEAEEGLARSTEVAPQAWRDLAQAFVHRLGEEKVWRTPA